MIKYLDGLIQVWRQLASVCQIILSLELIQAEGPLIGPSANKSGKASGRYFDQIRAQFDFQVTGYQDDDALLGVDSTILDLSVSPAKILRQGKITKEDLLAALPELTIE